MGWGEVCGKAPQWAFLQWQWSHPYLEIYHLAFRIEPKGFPHPTQLFSLPSSSHSPGRPL